MPHPLAVAVAFLLASAAHAETPVSVEQIPVTERRQEHFYGAIAGRGKLSVKWEVSPVSVPFGGSLTLSLVVSNAVNPHEIARPPLLDLPDFRDLFSAVEDLPPDPTASAATFRYRVTPRNEGAFHIPELKYRYYQPHAPVGYRTLMTHAWKVSFAVTKPAVPPAPPLIGPEEFFAVRANGAFSRSGGPDWRMWGVLLAVGVIVGTVWVAGWRRLYPDAARLAAIRRNRAVRVALDRLRRPKVTADAVAVTLRNYLIARYGLKFTAQTPAEVATGLAEVGVPPDRAAEAEGVLRSCDATRFAAATGTGVSAAAVAAMIERWEGVNPPSG